MSIRAVLVALAFAVAVLVLALVYGRNTGTATKTIPVLGFDPVALSAIEVHDGDTKDRIQRTTDGGWAWSDPDDHAITWPAIYPGSAQTAIGALSSLESEPMPKSDPISGDTWQIRFEAGSTTKELRISKSQLGGYSRAENSDGQRFRIESSLTRPLVEPGLSSWRTARAVPGLFDASRIWIEKNDQTFALARVSGEWSIIQPVAARADSAAVASLVDTIAQLNVERFEPRGARTIKELGIDAPTMTLRLQRDARRADAAGDVATVTTESALFVGSEADPQGTLLHALSATDARLVLLVAATNLAAIPTEPKTLLAKTPSAAQPSDVFGINIRTLETETAAKRSMGEWSGISAEHAEELLAFLCTTPGEPNVLHADDEIISLSRVELTALDGGRLDLINIGYTSDAVLAARAGSIVWLYAGAEPPAALGLPAFADIPEQPDHQTPASPTGTYSK